MKKDIFQTICSQVFDSLKKNEQLTVYLEGENSQYFRFNDSKLRQSGIIEDYAVTISLFSGKKSLQSSTTLSSDIKSSVSNLTNEINALRDPLSLIPENDFTCFPDPFESLDIVKSGQLPKREEILEALMDTISSDNLTGVWTSGKIFRACSTSEGTNHWFEKDSFIFDFSLIDAQENMVKVLFPGSNWDKSKFVAVFHEASEKLKLMNKPKMELKPGKYRVWFEPNAVADFVDMFNWNGVSESSFRNGSSCLLKLRNSDTRLSNLFSLNESFSSLSTAPFNSRGEVSEDVAIIQNGILSNTLVNAKTALEYKISSNFALSLDLIFSCSLKTSILW